MRKLICLLLAIPLLASAQPRIKDIAKLEGVSELPVIGYGIVVGLDGTGDSPRALFTNQALLNMLDRFGISVESDRVRTRNVAGVIVTANIPPFSKSGKRVDVQVSSLGDARSLLGGILLLTPVVGPDEVMYGVVQGAVSIGGFAVEAAGVSIKQNVNQVGRIPNGLVLEKDVAPDMVGLESIRWTLNDGDATTASRMAEVIDEALGRDLATVIDPMSVEITIPEDYPGGTMAIITETESLPVVTDRNARVVVNERTGTVIIGAEVQLSSVAISHGSLSITIVTQPIISQPNPFSPGRTVVQRTSQVQVQQGGEGVVVMEESTNVGDVAQALNSLGVSPRDIIAIFQALKEAGALHAELVIM